MEAPKIEQQRAPSPTESRAGILEKLGNLLREILNSADTRAKRYTLEEMSRPEIVAQVILGQIGNPLRKRFGRNPWENGFSLVTLLSNMGHGPLETTRNYFAELSGEKRKYFYALRGTLKELSGEGKPLLEYPLEGPDAYGETVHYKVVNEKLLREMA